MTTVTAIPNPNFRGLYSLLNAMRAGGCAAPAVRIRGCLLFWSETRTGEGCVVFKMADRGLHSVTVGRIKACGTLITELACRTEDVLTLRNFAADPMRKLRRFGFDEQACPFCDTYLPHGTLAFNVGHCEECAVLVGLPFDQFTADRAEDELRVDIQRELEDENRQG